MSACPDVATKKKISVRTKETATFNVRRIKVVNKRSMAITLKMIGSHAAVNSIVRVTKYVKVINRLEIIAIEIANALPTSVRITCVIKLANKTRKITILILS